MTRDPVPAPVPQQPAVGAGLTAAIAQGAARSITTRLVDKSCSPTRPTGSELCGTRYRGP